MPDEAGRVLGISVPDCAWLRAVAAAERRAIAKREGRDPTPDTTDTER